MSLKGYKVAQRYAKGFYDFLASADKQDASYASIQHIESTLANHQELKRFLNSPVVTNAAKSKAILEIFKSVDLPTQTFLKFIIDQGRVSVLGQIATAYIQLVDAHKGLLTSQITSAIELSKDQIDAIVEKGKTKLGIANALTITTKVDPSILGGYILRIGDQQIDDSVKYKLSQLREQFSV